MSQAERDKHGQEFQNKGETLLIEGRVEQLEREQKESRARDEEYKRLQVLYNKRVAWFTGGLLVTSFITNLIYLDMSRTARKSIEVAKQSADAAKSAADAAKEAADTSRSQLELSERPWVSADAQIAGPLVFDKQGVHTTLQFILKNTGHSPAVGMLLDSELYIQNPTKVYPTVERKRLCDELIKRGPDLGETLFPGNVRRENWTVNAGQEDVLKSMKLVHGIVPAVVACIAYRPSFNSQSHYSTGIIVNLSHFDPVHPNLWFGFTKIENVPIEKLRLFWNIAGISAQ